MIDATHIRLECLKLANGNITLAKEYLTFVNEDISLNGGYRGYMAVYNDYKDIFDGAMNQRSQNWDDAQTSSRFYTTGDSVDIPPMNISYMHGIIDEKEEIKEHVIENDNFIKEKFKDAW